MPDSCRLTIDRRFLLEEDLATVKGEVTGILERLKRERKKFDYEIRDLMEVLPLMTERDAPVVKAVAQGIHGRRACDVWQDPCPSHSRGIL